jgi:hypothetical protein
MGLLEILDHRLCGAAQDEPLSPGPGQAVFLATISMSARPLCLGSPSGFAPVAPKADSLPELHANYVNRSVDSHRTHCPQEKLGTIWEQSLPKTTLNHDTRCAKDIDETTT